VNTSDLEKKKHTHKLITVTGWGKIRSGRYHNEHKRSPK